MRLNAMWRKHETFEPRKDMSVVMECRNIYKVILIISTLSLSLFHTYTQLRYSDWFMFDWIISKCEKNSKWVVRKFNFSFIELTVCNEQCHYSKTLFLYCGFVFMFCYLVDLFSFIAWPVLYRGGYALRIKMFLRTFYSVSDYFWSLICARWA